MQRFGRYRTPEVFYLDDDCFLLPPRRKRLQLPSDRTTAYRLVNSEGDDLPGLVIGPHSEVQGRNQQPGRIMLNLATPDVKAEFERIKAVDAEVVAEPYEPGGGGGMLMCTFADPDGNYFQLSTPWDPSST